MRGAQRTGRPAGLVENYNSRFDPDDYMWLVDWRRYDKPYCSVYVITPDNEWPCKIGVSVFPEKRLQTLQTSVWRRLKVAKCFVCNTTTEARRLEKKVHRTLTDDAKWLHGEWFDMRPDEAADIVTFAASVEGVECTDKIEDEHIRGEVYAFVHRWVYDPGVMREVIDRRGW